MVSVNTSAVAEKVILELEAKVDRFVADVNKAAQRFKKSTGEMENRGRQFEGRMASTGKVAGTRFLKGFLGGFAVQQIVAALGTMVKNLARIGDIGQQVGLTTDQVQELTVALEKNGATAKQAQDGLLFFADQSAVAARGQGQLYEWLKANNVAIRDQNGAMRPQAQLLGEVFNLIQNARSPQEALNLAIDAFGKQLGPAAVKAASEGAAGIQRLGDEAHRTGQILKKELIDQASEIEKKWQDVARTFSVAVKGALLSALSAAQEFASKANVAQALDKGTASAAQLAFAIDLAKRSGSPIHPSWIRDLERLTELEFERRRANSRNGPVQSSSTLPPVTNTGRPTVTPVKAPTVEKLDSFERSVQQIEKRIAVMTAETTTIDLNTAARERARVVAELETAAKQANKQAGLKNTEVTAAQRIEIDKLADAYGAAAAAAEAAASPLNSFAREAAKVDMAIQEATVNGLRGFEDAIIGIVDGTVKAKDAFRQMANAIIADLIRISIRQSITGPLASLFGGFMPIPGRAAGGPVLGGSPYMVGEKGPELFVPNTSGNIIPAGKSAGGNVIVHVSNHNDFRGAQENAVSALSSKLAQLERSIPQTVVRTIEGVKRSRPEVMR